MDLTIRRAEPSDYEEIWRTYIEPGAQGGTLYVDALSMARIRSKPPPG